MENNKTSDDDLKKLLDMLEGRVSRGESLAWDDVLKAAHVAVGRQYTRQGLHKLRVFGERLAQAKEYIKAEKIKQNVRKSSDRERLNAMVLINQEMIEMLIGIGAHPSLMPSRLMELSDAIAKEKLLGSSHEIND